MIDVPVDAEDDEAVAATPVTTSISVRSELVIKGPISGIFGVGADILAELDLAVLPAVASAVEVFVRCVGDALAGVWTGTVFNIDVTSVTRVEMLVVLVVVADTLVVFAPDIGGDVLPAVMPPAMTGL